MKLRDGLVLREVAGQYVIVPTGAAVREVTDIVYISASAAYLWNYIEYYGAAEPSVRCGESHLSGLTEPPIDSYSA